MKDDMAAAFAKLTAPRAEGFAIKRRILPAKRAFDAKNARDRSRRRALVKPENALAILDALPAKEGERMHAVTPGDFVFCDLLTAICRKLKPEALYLSTLSMSKKNADAICAEVAAGQPPRAMLLLSNYFAGTNGEIFDHLKRRAEQTPGVTVGTLRTHAKVALFDCGAAGKLIIETSANLRSSDNVEQISAFMDADLFEFHRGWIEGAIAADK